MIKATTYFNTITTKTITITRIKALELQLEQFKGLGLTELEYNELTYKYYSKLKQLKAKLEQLNHDIEQNRHAMAA